MISQKAKYAIKALVALAGADGAGPLSIRDMATRERIPPRFLEQILLQLRRAGLVASRRGACGGYVLAETPAAIGLGRILRLIDGPVAPLPCLSRTAYRRCADCADEGACTVRRVFAEMYDKTVEILDRTSLQDALDAPDPGRLTGEAGGAEHGEAGGAEPGEGGGAEHGVDTVV